jgi:FkbM family methyltransferase
MPTTQQIADIKFSINEREFAFQMTYDPAYGPDADTMICMQRFGCPEPEVVHLMTRVLRPGDFAIDGGANIGFFTLVMSQLVDRNGIVLAVEPGDNNLPKLKENLKLNAIKNVDVCERPLWSSNEHVTLHYHQHGGMNSLADFQPMMRKQILQATTLSTWATSPRLIKLDIEGAEEHALRGATKHLVSACPFIVCELNTKALEGMGSSQERLRRFMREWGYSTFLLYRGGELPTLVPDKTTIFEPNDQTGTVNILFSTVEKVGNAWPRAVVKYV